MPNHGRNRGSEPPDWVVVDDLLTVDHTPECWVHLAGCIGQPLDVFFPATDGYHLRRDYSDAEPICDACPVRLQCLAWWLAVSEANTDPNTGCYVGGTTPVQRRSLRQDITARRRARWSAA